MATVTLTPAAVAYIQASAQASQFAYPVLVVSRTPGNADLRRTEAGEAQWHITDVEGWHVQLLGAESPADYDELHPFPEAPALALHLRAGSETLAGRLIVDKVNGELTVAGTAI